MCKIIKQCNIYKNANIKWWRYVTSNNNTHRGVHMGDVILAIIFRHDFSFLQNRTYEKMNKFLSIRELFLVNDIHKSDYVA